MVETNSSPVARDAHNRRNLLLLSQVDIMTNGLGGMLLLFFLLVLSQQDVTWLAEQVTATAAGERQDPMVVLVMTASSQPLFDPGRQPAWDGVTATAENSALGATYAVLTLAEAPSEQTPIRLGPVAADRPITVRVVAHGQPARDFLHQSGDHVQVWPFPGSVPAEGPP